MIHDSSYIIARDAYDSRTHWVMRITLSTENDSMEVTLQRLKDARRFALAWGIKMDMESATREFVVSDSVLHYAASTNKLVLRYTQHQWL